MHLRIEQFADELDITSVHFASHRQVYALVKTTRTGPCSARVYMSTDGRVITGFFDLTFAATGITGSASPTYKIVEETDEGEDLWRCQATGVGITGIPVKP